MKMMQVENGKKTDLPKTLLKPIDDMVTYAKNAKKTLTNNDNNNMTFFYYPLK